jgi:hypothetical protein
MGTYCIPGTVAAMPCAAGYYGGNTGFVSPSCSSSCSVYSYCPPGSVFSNQVLQPAACPLGYYCSFAAGASVALPCPAGRYGGSTGLTSPSCSGPCTQGWFCAAGSTSPTQYTSASCPVGSWCNAANGTAVQPCAGGYYGATAGLSTPTCSGPCNASYWCAPGSAVSQQYTAATCPPGYYCPAGGAALPCPAGRWAGARSCVTTTAMTDWLACLLLLPLALLLA